MPSICSAIYFDDYVHIKILTYFRLIWVERKLNAPSYTTLLVAHFRQCHTPSFKAHFHREDCDVLLSVCRERSINVRSLLLSPQSPPSPPSTPNMDLYFIQIDGLKLELSTWSLPLMRASSIQKPISRECIVLTRCCAKRPPFERM